MAEMRVQIEGMSCAHCVRAVFTALTAVEGITRADVSIGQATIEHDGRATEQAVAEAVEVAGYKATGFAEQRRKLPTM